jgi:predicted phage baseplate assembly protein
MNMADDGDVRFDFLPQLPKDNLDDRTFEDLVAECILRIPRYCPEWTDYNPSDPGITLIELFSWLTDQMLLRFNKVPRRNYITFLELLGIRLQAPASATTEVTFYITEPDTFPYRIPMGTEIGTERTATEEAIVFSTERDLLVGQPTISYFLTARTTEESPRLLRDSVTHQWTREDSGDWGGSEQTLFDEQPEVGNCFYLIFDADQPLEGNVLAVTFKGLGATPTGIDPDRPPRIWEAWDGETWQPVLLREGDDFTQGFSFNRLREAGASEILMAEVLLHLPQRWPVTVFTGYEGRWLRCRYIQPQPEQPGFVNTPRINALRVRAMGGTVSASHSSVIRDELLGISEGIPGQSFQLTNPPLLERRDDEYIVVIPTGGIPQSWKEVQDFADSKPEDRHYTLDSLTGKLQFGPLIQEPSRAVHAAEERARTTPLPAVDNYPTRRSINADGPLEKQYGSIPPRGAEIRMRQYRSGGGRSGNVERERLTVMKTSIPYITRVVNYQPARGGADGESLQQAVLRVPRLLRTRDRAVTREDFETLTLEAARGSVAQTLCIPPSNSSEAGTVSIIVIPAANTDAIERGEGISPDKFDLNPELEAQISDYLAQRKLLGVQIRLRGAEYTGVSVQTQVGLEPTYSNPQAQEMLRHQLEIILYRFLNPITGGLDGKGWPFGRPVYTSDIVALFQTVPGVRYLGPVLLFELRSSRQQGELQWQRNPEPLQMVDPGPRGLICSWKNRPLRSSHVINLITS